MHTKNFGDVIQIEVGAMMVGKIVNYDGKTDIKRGEEMGKFLYGGSTIILLLNQNIKIDDDIIKILKMVLRQLLKWVKNWRIR